MRPYLPALLIVPLLNGATADNLRTRTHPFNGSSKSDPSFLPADKIQKFNRMPPAIQAKIAEIFQEANIDAKVDGEYLDWDDDGQVLYADPPPPNDTDVDEFPIDDGTTKQYPEDAPVQLSGVPIYHSKLGAPYTLYLDFDGHKFSGRAWNSAESFDMYPYNRGGGDPDTFTGEELDIIGRSWAVVAEDFAPFDVDVTTEEPPLDDASTANNWIFANTVGHVLITAKTDRNGKIPYNCNCGGVAYVNVFGGSNYKDYYSPAFVFNTSFKGVAEAISHEFGHNLGLSHDGKGTVGYYTGHGPDGAETEWAPIMGVGYYAQIAQWSKGEYPDATQVQDDLAIIANKIPYRADDHTSEEPLIDGYAEGIIERNTDIDTFTFYGSGSTTVDIVTRSMDYGNLDAGLRILDNNGVVISGGQVETPNAKDASWTGTLAPGDYKIQVYGTGNGDDWITGYGDYGSLGQYEVYMTTEAGTLSPTKAPTPSPSAGPTKNPTLSPQIPTPSPTANPSMSPTTASPTKSLSPSKSPTGSPTKNPTTSPTDKPSKTPTVFPTNSPTDKPTSCNPRFQACPIVSSDPPCCNNNGCWVSGGKAGQCK